MTAICHDRSRGSPRLQGRVRRHGLRRHDHDKGLPQVGLATSRVGLGGPSRAVGEGRLSEVCALEEAIRQLGPSREPLIAEFVECARLRRGFAGFLRRVHSYGGRTAVVTAAFSEAIEAVWRSERLDPVVLVAAELRDKRSGGFELVPNRLLGDCPSCGGGRCKGGMIRALRKPGDVVVFGDGAAICVWPARRISSSPAIV